MAKNKEGGIKKFFKKLYDEVIGDEEEFNREIDRTWREACGSPAYEVIGALKKEQIPPIEAQLFYNAINREIQRREEEKRKIEEEGKIENGWSFSLPPAGRVNILSYTVDFNYVNDENLNQMKDILELKYPDVLTKGETEVEERQEEDTKPKELSAAERLMQSHRDRIEMLKATEVSMKLAVEAREESLADLDPEEDREVYEYVKRMYNDLIMELMEK